VILVFVASICHQHDVGLKKRYVVYVVKIECDLNDDLLSIQVENHKQKHHKKNLSIVNHYHDSFYVPSMGDVRQWQGMMYRYNLISQLQMLGGFQDLYLMKDVHFVM
jgi:hypothetical protein